MSRAYLMTHDMREHQIRRIPIVDEHGICVGIVSQKDVALNVDEPRILSDTVREISRPNRPQTMQRLTRAL